MMHKKITWVPTLLLVLGSVTIIAFLNLRPHFHGERALQDVSVQLALGPRVPGSLAHVQVIAYILAELSEAGWEGSLQRFDVQGIPITNIVAVRGAQHARILLGAHYDSRLLADQEEGPGSAASVPGANDGASGVAILLELARVLPDSSVPVMLVFFDEEDNGGLESRQWIMGSTAFVSSLVYPPECAIIVDMVGDKELFLPKERNSDPELTADIWDQAARLGYPQFVDQPGYSLIDDHTPFLQAGIPAVDIIDFDYPYWHTTQDRMDKVSAASLQAVGSTLLRWISRYR